MLLNVVLAQLSSTVGNPKENSKRIKEVWAEYDKSTHMVVFPELFLSGYPPEDLLLRQGFLMKCME
ncbi:MAG: NAD+ synthase, partial [Aquificota bacterium]